MPVTRPSFVRDWCRRNGFHPNRTLGQNFMIDGNTVALIVAAAAPARAGILEIGPGLGALTQALLATGAAVTAIEKDSRLAEWLRGFFAEEERLRLIEADALDIDLDSLLTDAAGQPSFDLCVSNLPYSSGTRILLELCSHPHGPRELLVTVQLEVAERLAALPGGSQRGLAGVWVQRNHDVTILRKIKPSCFWPRPEIVSALVKLERHAEDEIDATTLEAFKAVTRHAFSQRRKKLMTALRSPPAEWGLSDEGLSDVFKQIGLDENVRAEELGNRDWLSLAAALARVRRQPLANVREGV